MICIFVHILDLINDEHVTFLEGAQAKAPARVARLCSPRFAAPSRGPRVSGPHCSGREPRGAHQTVPLLWPDANL